MGISHSKKENYGRNLFQETAFIKYLSRFGKEFNATIEIPYQKFDTKACLSGQQIGINPVPESPTSVRVTQMGDFPFERVNKTLIMSACAFQGRPEIDNILDGYNCGLVIIIENTNHGAIRLKFAQKPIQDEMFKRELQALPNDEKLLLVNGSKKLEHKKTLDSMKDVAPKKISCLKGGLWSGLFNGSIHLWNLIRSRTLTDRVTAHQPIWCQGYVWFCAPVAWQQVQIQDHPNKLLITLNALHESVRNSPLFQEITSWPKRKQVFFCTHPHEDVNFINFKGKPEPRMLTYSFKFSKLSEKTDVTFFEFGLDEKLKDNLHKSTQKITKLRLSHYAQLHMFGFTKNFYLIFANPLSVDKYKIAFKGTPILRALNDVFQCNLIIHIVRRPDAPSWLPKYMIVDTKQQGNMYHTVNCFEEWKFTEKEINEYVKKYSEELKKMTGQDPSQWNHSLKNLVRQYFPTNIVLDGWASQLNAARESSQFELKQDCDHNVYENQGNLYRFNMHLEKETFKVIACQNQCVCPEIISSIDFHCINNYNYGRSYRYFWLVAHRRNRTVSPRNPFGDIEYCESILYGIKMPSLRVFADPWDLFPDHGDPWRTTDHFPLYSSEKRLISYYMRTPTFIAKENISSLSGTQEFEAGKKEMKEKDGYLFVWVYRMVHDAVEMKKNNMWESAARYDEEEKSIIHMVSKIGESIIVDENLLRPYMGGQSAKLKPKNSLKISVQEEGGFISALPLKSAAILLIFDALTFNSRSRPWIIEFDEDVTIPYSVHSYSHQFTMNDLTESEKKDADEERGKVMKKAEIRFMEIYQSVLLTSKKSYKLESSKKNTSNNKENKDVFDFVNEIIPEEEEQHPEENIPEEGNKNHLSALNKDFI